MSMSNNIHSLAVVEDGAVIGKNVTIEPFAVVKNNVTLKDNVIIKSHAYIDGHTTIGEGSIIWPGASIGTKTQDKKFRGERTFVRIGKNTEVREYVTINSSCGEDSEVVVGDDCLLMAYCHVAHHCVVGNGVIMANGVMLAGHVTVEDYANLGGMTPFHQFTRIGKYAMVGGMSRVSHDIPPYTVGGGIPYRFGGLNIIGLKRHNFPFKTRQLLAQAFKITYRMGLHLEDSIKKIESELEQTEEIKNWLEFCKDSKRGLQGLHGIVEMPKREVVEEKDNLIQKINI